MHSSELTQERRQLYRMTLGEENQVEVALWTDSGDGLVGEAVDISAQGVAIRVLRSVAPVLSLGESVAFPFTPRNQTEPVALRATVRSRNLMGKHWRYGFRFQLKNMVNMRFAEEFYGLFNRRNAFRVKPLPAEPIPVTIASLEASAPPIVTSQLNDVSATGLSVLLSSSTNPSLTDVGALSMTLRPPTSTRSLKLAGRIRHRTLHGSNVCYGLQFDAEYTGQFEQDHEDLVDYIIHRQLEDLANHPDPSLTRSPLQLDKTSAGNQLRTA
jgi:c-di-GMP-binding flagellar brake protein YcgR